jgi:hypothetical protein
LTGSLLGCISALASPAFTLRLIQIKSLFNPKAAAVFKSLNDSITQSLNGARVAEGAREEFVALDTPIPDR